MDKYRDYIARDKISFQKMPKLPRSNIPLYYKLDVSFDRFIDFINQYGNKQLPLLEINIYDEDIITNQGQINIRFKLLNLINRLNTIKINFFLSDSTLPLYNSIMYELGWEHQDKTQLSLKTDRNPIPRERRNLQLEKSQGKLLLPEEKLIWCTPATLYEIKDKVDEKVLSDAIKLKEIVFEYYCILNSLYHVEEFTDFDKIWLAYDFIKRHIAFADEAVIVRDGREWINNPNGINDWASHPLGTYQHKKGVCEGQARLMQVLLNNPYLKCDTTTISGMHPLGSHAWSGTIVDGKLYQTCLTMSNLLKPLDRMGYIPDDDQVYPHIYQSSSLNERELKEVQEHIKLLRK